MPHSKLSRGQKCQTALVVPHKLSDVLSLGVDPYWILL
jgi:hypothetical protein